MRYNTKIEKYILLWLICLLTGLPGIIYGQADKKFIRQGNSEYKDKKYSESELAYRKAIDKNKLSTDAGFNLGDALYRQNKYEEAGKQFLENSEAVTDNTKKSAGFYNMGNSLLNNNKVEESIQAYKNSLKLNPGDKQAKYNLAYAQDLLKKQQQQQKDQQNKDNNKEDKKQDQNKDQNKDQKQDQNKDQKQDQQQGISKEDAQRLLNAIANDEKNVQEKVKLEKAAKEKVRTLINW
jgi:Ca-activated chloride channel family protein